MKKVLDFLLVFYLLMSNFNCPGQSSETVEDSLLGILKISGQDTSRVHVLNDLSKTYIINGDYEKALIYIEEAEALGKKLNFKKGLAGSYNLHGAVYRNHGDYPKALEKFFNSLKIKEELGDKMSIVGTLSNIGTIYSAQMNSVKALEYQQRALKISEEIGHKKGIATALHNIGFIYDNLGDYPKAINYSLQSLKIKEEINDRNGVAVSLNNIGGIYIAQGHYDKALEVNLRSLKINEELGNKYGVVVSFINLGETYFGMNNNNLAIEYNSKALLMAEQLEAYDLIKDANNNLRKIYTKMGKFEKALLHYEAFIIARDSLYNEDNTKKFVQNEMKFEFEKKEQITKIEQEKKDAIAREEKEKQKVIRNSFIGGFVLLLLLSGVIFRSYNNKKRANELISLQKREVEEQKHVIEEKQKEILDSIHYAKRIQNTLLAHHDFLNEHLPDNFALFKPKDIVSGDFYWAAKSGDRFYLAVCDSTGHGVPGAFMCLLNIGFLSEAINEKNIVEPNEVFNYVRKRLQNSISKEGQKDGFDGILISVNTRTNEISYAAANNQPILIANNNYMELEKDRMPVGVGERQEDFKLYKIKANKGDMLYLYTDGFADQFGGAKGKKFKYKALNELLLSNHHLPLVQQSSILNERFEEWRGDLEQVDDVCLIGVRI